MHKQALKDAIKREFDVKTLDIETLASNEVIEFTQGWTEAASGRGKAKLYRSRIWRISQERTKAGRKAAWLCEAWLAGYAAYCWWARIPASKVA